MDSVPSGNKSRQTSFPGPSSYWISPPFRLGTAHIGKLHATFDRHHNEDFIAHSGVEKKISLPHLGTAGEAMTYTNDSDNTKTLMILVEFWALERRS